MYSACWLKQRRVFNLPAEPYGRHGGIRWHFFNAIFSRPPKSLQCDLTNLSFKKIILKYTHHLIVCFLFSS
jgi:hypothetical protein